MDKPITVFIDTSIFKKHGFSVNKTMFNTFRSLCQSNKIQFLSTDITQSEIESNILQSIKELKTAFKKIEKENRIIETIGGQTYKEFIDKKSTAEMLSDIKKDIDTFFEECNIQIINASEQSGGQIFNDYFSKAPPFGEGKKKHEFPDAFVLSALKGFFPEKNKNIIAVSTDKDFKSFCENEDKFKYFETLYEFINWILQDEDNVVTVIHKIIEDNKQKISKLIEHEIENNGMYVDDADGEIFFETLQSCQFMDISVVGLNKNHASLFIDVDVTLNLEASYWDPDSWYTVKDDGVKEVYYHDQIEGTVERNFTIEVEFEMEFNARKSILLDIKNFEVNSGSPLAYSHYDFDDYG